MQGFALAGWFGAFEFALVCAQQQVVVTVMAQSRHVGSAEEWSDGNVMCVSALY